MERLYGKIITSVPLRGQFCIKMTGVSTPKHALWKNIFLRSIKTLLFICISIMQSTNIYTTRNKKNKHIHKMGIWVTTRRGWLSNLVNSLLSNDPSCQLGWVQSWSFTWPWENPEISTNLFILLESSFHLFFNSCIIQTVNRAHSKKISIELLFLRIMLEGFHCRALLVQTSWVNQIYIRQNQSDRPNAKRKQEKKWDNHFTKYDQWNHEFYEERWSAISSTTRRWLSKIDKSTGPGLTHPACYQRISICKTRMFHIWNLCQVDQYSELSHEKTVSYYLCQDMHHFCSTHQLQKLSIQIPTHYLNSKLPN